MDVPVLVHVGIAIAMSGSLTDGQISSMKTETALLWAPYGVRLTWVDRVQDCNVTQVDVRMPPVDIMIEVAADVDAPAVATGAEHIALGTVHVTNHVWSRTVYLALRPVMRMVLDASVAGVSIKSWPSPVFDRLLGQALGRVLAHELGHVLLALPTHTIGGLMHPSLTAADLIAPGHGHLMLNRTLVARLTAQLATRPTAPLVGGAAASR